MKKKKKAARSKAVKFTLKAEGAKTVRLAGDFNNWNYTKTTLKKSRGQVWQKSLSLKPGRYEYKFVVDGAWINDPDNSTTVTNSYGTLNSVIEI